MSERFELRGPDKTIDLNKQFMNPIDVIMKFDPTDFEIFICEWLALTKKYSFVNHVGSAGDKGRDAIGYSDSKTCDYYQCKRYNAKLTFSSFLIEFGKLIYYTYTNEIPIPQNYYIISAKGADDNFIDYLSNPDSINQELIDNWTPKFSSSITKKHEIVLDRKLTDYIKNFDFSIVQTIDIFTVLAEYSETSLFYFRFGGQNKPVRSPKITSLTSDSEQKDSKEEYIEQILSVYSAEEKEIIDFRNIDKYKKYKQELLEHRISFHNANSLKRDLREINMIEEFEDIKSEIHIGIRNVIRRNHISEYSRMITILEEAMRCDLSSSFIFTTLNFVRNTDREGICHHLVNENIMRWSAHE
ncbi:ABC-three component system protein [Erysipelothrix aquatica]|uniref:ABC-three component system protein n=1 Tax=Erysipelothrix aquatica TaxID=2683714 RepID=UPI001F254402|nr:ABC-three component system protein [Erysipelothrix aquatica]